MRTSTTHYRRFLPHGLAMAALLCFCACNSDRSANGDTKSTGGSSATAAPTAVATGGGTATNTLVSGKPDPMGGSAGAANTVGSAFGSASTVGATTSNVANTSIPVGGTTSSVASAPVTAKTNGGTTSANGGASNTGGSGGTKTTSGRAGSSTALSDILLPRPRLTDDAHPVLKALGARQSTRAFSTAELSNVQQSEIIWAAFGVNRTDNRRTAPSAWNCQDIELYLATSAGVFKYNAIEHSSVQVSSLDVRRQFGSPYDTAPLTIVYVSSQSKIPAEDKVRYSYVHTGLIGMNVYLYAAYENLPVVIRSDVPSALALSLNLANDQVITLVQTVGLASGQSNALGVPFQAGSFVTPRNTTHPILKALKNRKSASGFASTALTEQTLGEVLWAGFGVNRTDGRRTAPTAHNYQDIDIYAAMASGVYRYDAINHVLKAISRVDVRPLISTSYSGAPLTLVYVSDYSKISSTADQARYSAAHAGFVAQNVNAYAASENLAAKVYESINDQNGLLAALQLASHQRIKLIQTVGAPPGN